jgi:hypothetical protein
VPGATEEVVPPESLGRWRAHDADLVAAVEDVGRAALERFGYRLGA